MPVVGKNEAKIKQLIHGTQIKQQKWKHHLNQSSASSAWAMSGCLWPSLQSESRRSEAYDSWVRTNDYWLSTLNSPLLT